MMGGCIHGPSGRREREPWQTEIESQPDAAAMRAMQGTVAQMGKAIVVFGMAMKTRRYDSSVEGGGERAARKGATRGDAPCSLICLALSLRLTSTLPTISGRNCKQTFLLRRNTVGMCFVNHYPL